MHEVPAAVAVLAERLTDLGWVSDLWAAGSLATGDYVPGVSDIDLVARVDHDLDESRVASLVQIHRLLDQGTASGLDLGCIYTTAATIEDVTAVHPTWTHGALVQRILSGVTRAELVRYGFAIRGRQPAELLPAMSDDDLRAAAHAELCGYWSGASRHPTWWLTPSFADLSLTAMARGRYTLRTGSLLTKSAAVEQAAGPGWLIEQLRARRQGGTVASPRTRTAWISWRDARRTVTGARRSRRL